MKTMNPCFKRAKEELRQYVEITQEQREHPNEILVIANLRFRQYGMINTSTVNHTAMLSQIKEEVYNAAVDGVLTSIFKFVDREFYDLLLDARAEQLYVTNSTFRNFVERLADIIK
jgi:hypothetical protein